jgi:hypothetical protein
VSFDDERRAVEANGGRPVARTALIDRNPKDRSDLRVTRLAEGRDRQGDNNSDNGRSQSGSTVTSTQRFSTRQRLGLESRDAGQRERGTEARDRNLGRSAGSAIETMRATEENSDRSGTPKSQREWSQGRSAAGSAPIIDNAGTAQAPPSRQRHSSDWAERAQRQPLDQSRALDARQREQVRDFARESQRFQRESVQRQPAPRIEQQRNDSPRQDAAQRQSQPRIERSAPAPRSMSQGSNEGRSGNHMGGGQRGHSSRER